MILIKKNRINKMRHTLVTTFVLLFCFGAYAGPVQTEITMEFSHPGDDGTVGTAAKIEWRWTTDTLANWPDWILITDTITPQLALTLDTAFLAIEFPEDGTYWIAVTAKDEASNWTDICSVNEITLADEVGPSCISATVLSVVRK